MTTVFSISDRADCRRAAFSTLIFCILFSLASRSGSAQQGPTPETYVYKSVGNCRIKADVYRPEKGAARNLSLFSECVKPVARRQ
jgi:hypothetical protein